MRIGGEAPGRRVHSAQRLGSHGFYGELRCHSLKSGLTHSSGSSSSFTSLALFTQPQPLGRSVPLAQQHDAIIREPEIADRPNGSLFIGWAIANADMINLRTGNPAYDAAAMQNLFFVHSNKVD